MWPPLSQSYASWCYIITVGNVFLMAKIIVLKKKGLHLYQIKQNLIN